MTRSMHRAIVVLLGVAALGSAAFLEKALSQQLKAVPAQRPGGATPMPANPDDELSQAITLPTDTGLKRKIEAAQDYMKEEDWGKAAQILQSLVELKEDMFVQVGRLNKQGVESMQWTSVRAEANRLIGTMPPKGLDFYRLQFGAGAKDLLDKAEQTSDTLLLAEVAQKYLHTDAGARATNLLGTYHLDRGNFVIASLCFDRLIGREGADKLSPVTLFKAAQAFHKAGDKDNEKRVWDNLGSRGRSLKLGTQTLDVAELKEMVEKQKNLTNPRTVYDHTVYRGNPQRNAQGVGGTAFMEPNWKQSLFHPSAGRGFAASVKDKIDRAVKVLEDRQQPVLPSFFPVAASGKFIFKSYWGVHAVDMKTGKLLWESRSNWSLQAMANDLQKATTVEQWVNMYLQQNSKPSMLFENSTVGSLSTDNQRVYVVEDLAVPPPATPGIDPRFGGRVNTSWGPGITEAVSHNRLQAFDLESGKLIWELGGVGDQKGTGTELHDSYFLGPPLPMGGKLYALTEKREELRLVCLDPAKGEISWTQALATARDKMVQDVNRRTQAAHLAYGEGVLICPTNAGAILAVDLLSRSLVWAYPYRERSADQRVNPTTGRLPPGAGIGPGGVIIGPDGRPIINHILPDWKTSAPVIQDGKVVFTAPDGSSVHCVSLRDGERVWKQNRQEDDLYLAGVVQGKALVVGKKSCRALDLSSGATVWNLATGMPSGQGVASDEVDRKTGERRNLYYLPLKTGAQKKPEICAIDVDRGRVHARTQSRKNELPGNLLFYEGAVLSQTATEVVAYPQAEVKEEQMNERIAKNPKDPVGLTERGELRLDRGDLSGAVEDLREALRNDPPKDVIGKTRTKLYETLTELMSRDFDAAEKFLDEYKEMCKVEPAPGAADLTPEQQEEQRRRQGNFLCLVAKGREGQGRLVEAFQAYLDFGALAGKQELISSLDEPSVRTPPDVWSQGRIAAMIEKVNDKPDLRKPLEDKITQTWDEVKKGNDLDKLRQFVAMFGSFFGVGREARLHLAEQLAAEAAPNALLEAEGHLLLLSRQKDDAKLAGRAVETMARMLTKKGLLEDSAYYYRVLGRDFAEVEVRDGKTGADLFNDLATDKRFLPYLDEPVSMGMGGKLGVKVEHGNFQMTHQLFTFPADGEALPFFGRHLVRLNLSTNQLKVTDRQTGDERWSQSLSSTFFATLAPQASQPNGPRFDYQTMGHLMVLQLGHMVFGLDPVNKQLLWEKNLFGSALSQNPQVVAAGNGVLNITYPDGWMQRLGQAGPVEPAAVCLQTREGLIALDPVTGRMLWTRSDVLARSQVFGDGPLVYVVDTNADGTPSATRALRAHDGVSVPVKDFTALYAKRVRVMGRTLVVADGDRGPMVLKMYDVPTGKDVWSKEFPAGSKVLRSEEPHLAGAVDPKGKVTVLDLRTRQEVLAAQMQPEHVEKATAVHLLQDSANFYVAVNAPLDANQNPAGQAMSNLMPNTGMRSLPVNGALYAFDKVTAKTQWYAQAPQQMIVLEHFAELPMVLCTSRYQKWAGGVGAPNRFAMWVGAIKSIDKRTGKLLLDDDNLPNGMQFHALQLDPRGGKIDFVAYQMKITHFLTGGTASADAGGKTGASSTAQEELRKLRELEELKVRQLQLDRIRR